MSTTTQQSIIPSKQLSSLAPQWDEERIALLRKSIAPPNASPAEVEFFVAWCKRTGLDPFTKQAFFVERRAKVQTQRGEEWVTKFEPMASEAGIAGVADSQPDFAGMRAAAVYAGDEFSVDEQACAVTHRWSLEARAKAGNKVLGAWAHALRRERATPIVYLPLEARIQKTRDGRPTQFWERDPSGMIIKCARAAAYRVAYPNTLAGVYLREEFGSEVDESFSVGAQEPSTTPTPSTLPAASKTAALAAKLGAKPEPKPSPAKPEQPAPSAAPPVEEPPFSEGEPEQPKPEPKPKKAAKKEPAPAAAGAVQSIDRIRFGKAKGALIADASTVELEEALDVATAALAKAKGTEPWVAPTHEGIEAIEQEIARRESALDQPPPPSREPGEEG